MKLLLSVLVVANLLLFGWFRGWMAPFGGDGREPQRLDRQIQPQWLRIVQAPLPAAGPVVAGATPTMTLPPAAATETAPAASAATAAAASSAAPAAAADGEGPPAIEPPASLASVLKAAGCLEVGPIGEPETVRLHASLDLLPGEFAVSTRRADGVSTWMVFVVARSNALQKRLDELRERGVKDFYMLPESSAWRGVISLGLFKQEELALALQRVLIGRGVKQVRVAPRGPGPGPMTVQVRPVSDALLAELARLRAAVPAAAVRPCTARG